jgi:hypothetical protein
MFISRPENLEGIYSRNGATTATKFKTYSRILTRTHPVNDNAGSDKCLDLRCVVAFVA